MKTRMKQCENLLSVIFSGLFLLSVFTGTKSAQAIELGKTYDKTNYQEIQELLVPQVANWVKNGGYVIKTGKLNFDMKHEQAFIDASQNNEGKFGVSPEGWIVDKNTGERPLFSWGFPFPNIDPKDPKAAHKIMWNVYYQKYRINSKTTMGRVQWINPKNHEKEIIAGGRFLFFQGRSRGQIPNPNNFLHLYMTLVVEPYDLRGTSNMQWEFYDERTTASFSYLPMLRRIRRMSAASRSDPFMGSDNCNDDSDIWNGRNETFSWKFKEERSILVSFSSTDKIMAEEFPSGLIIKKFSHATPGFKVDGWQGYAWAPTDTTWVHRPVWILEGESQDSYYNYGRQIFYVDKEMFVPYFKICYTRAGEYWKTITSDFAYHVTPSGRTLIGGCTETTYGIDDKNAHGTLSHYIYWPGNDTGNQVDLPYPDFSADWFTTSAMIQLSK